MSAKKKKSLTSLVKCDACEIVLSDRDVTVHESDCPPEKSNLTCPYVFNNTLHCLLDVLPKNDAVLKHIPEEEHHGLIFLPVSVLQICGVPIGDHVVVETNSEKVVRKAWKSHDRVLLAAAVSEQDPCLVSKNLVKVSKLDYAVPIAREIMLESEENFAETEQVFQYIQQLYKNKIFCVGNKISFPYFGKILKFQIVEAVVYDNQDRREFFASLCNTFWKLRREIDDQPVDNLRDEIAGLDIIKKDLDRFFDKAFDSEKNSGSLKSRGILLHGPSGTGKTTLMKSYSRKWSKTVINVSLTSEKKEQYFQQCFLKAELGSPSVLTIDDVDVFCGKRNQQTVSILSSLFEKIHRSRANIVVIATTNKINDVDLSLRRSGRFDKEVEIPVPSPKERLEILEKLTGDELIRAEDLKIVADSTHGFVGADLMSLLAKASDCDGDLGTNLKKCLPLVRPSAMKEILIQVPDVRWEDIGGQDELKHQLKQAVEWPLKYPESFKRLGVDPPRGVLMYGPPGCSKTMIAKALATESGLNFISVKGPELFNKWVGESEKAVREVFRRARQAAPSIVFFDELDALAGERSSTSGGPQVQERVLAQLLTELDGVEALGHVVVVGATNRPDRIDPALLRPGRLDRVVYVPLPDLKTRCEIFRIRFEKTITADDVEINELAEKTEGYSGAEVVAVCNEAALAALDEDIKIPSVHRRHFLKALEIIQPRTSKNSLKLCEMYRNKK